ncbi:MAG: sulfotransferase [Chloroflexi bacterium]|nr:sulfotransferase [Chloroflexota bacterium]MBI3168051.1 sulfotransferase [Chloroflexota bacterium]
MKRIIVAGIYRSGTSLTAELVRRWGAYAGRDEDIFKDDYGYMEHFALQKLNDELLNNNSRVPTPVEVLLEKTQDASLTEFAVQALKDMDKEAQDHKATAWVWKDPRLPLVLPFWANIWGDAIYVIPVRHPVETIYSGAKMEGLDPEQVPLSAGFAYWQFCMLNLLRFTQDSPRKIFIAYDQLTQNPERECARLCRFLDEQCGMDSDPSERLQYMTEQVTAGERHFKHPRSLAEVETATREQRALYDFLRVKTMYPDEAYNKDDFALYPGWLEYLQTMDMFLSSTQGSQETE